LNTKSENNVNKYVGGLIAMHWQWTYAQKLSVVSIYQATCKVAESVWGWQGFGVFG